MVQEARLRNRSDARMRNSLASDLRTTRALIGDRVRQAMVHFGYASALQRALGSDVRSVGMSRVSAAG